jgi:hypothetical protein
LKIPTDPLIPALQMKGRGPKAQGTHDPRLRLHQITQLGTHQRTPPQRVLPYDEPVPNPVGRIVFMLNQAQSQSGNPTARRGQLGQGRQRLAIIRQAARPLRGSAPLRRRQLYQSASFQPAQRHAGRADSQFSVRLPPAYGATEFLNQLAAGRRRRSLGTPAQPFQNLTIYPSSTDSNRAQHPLTMHAHMLDV